MDTSPIMKLISMKTAIHVAEIHLERRVSQNVDAGLSFYLILCRRVEFQNNYKNHKSYPFFALK